MKIIAYQCTLCERSWEEQHVIGVLCNDNNPAILVDPEDSEKHICRDCIQAIQNYGNRIEEEIS